MFSDPVVGDKFFGRSEALKILSKRVNGLADGYRRNTAIIGPRLIGKSSLILHAFSNFSHDKIIPIYVDLLPNSFSHFAYKFLGTLLYHFLKKKNLEGCSELQKLKEQTQEYIPKTVELIHKIESDVKDLQFAQAFEKLLSLTSVLKQEADIFSIVILDEFQLLDSFKLKSPFGVLAKEIILQKDTMYLLVSSQVSYAKKILAGELSLLFGNFEIIQLEPFDYETSCKFLEKRLQNIALPSHLRDFLIVFSDKNPFYLDILSNKITQKAKEANRDHISPELVSQALNCLIYDSQGIFNQYFTSLINHNLNGADYSGFLSILLSCATKGMRLYEIIKALKYPPKIITKQINYLLDKDLLSKAGVLYRVQDKIFRFWLKSAYQRKRLSLTADPVLESKDFCKEIENQIISFSQDAQVRLTERIIELFKSFRNEIITIQNKSFKFCQFEEVGPFLVPQLQDAIIARYGNRYWLALIKNEEVTEMQVQGFCEFCRSSKLKIQRAIIISCKEIHLNVRLMALEKKIWIWAPADLSSLLDLYGKQQIAN